MSNFMREFNIRWENRNSEEVHNEALAEAKAYHDAINESARRATELYEAQQITLRLRQLAQQEEERVRAEEERVREEIRLREIENREKQIPKVPKRVPTPEPAVIETPKPAIPPATQPTQPPVSAPVSQPLATSNISPESQPPATQATPFLQTQPATTQPTSPFNPPQSSQPVFQAAQQPTSNPFASPPPINTPSTTVPQSSTFTSTTSRTSASAQSAPANARIQSTQAQSHSFLLRGVERYVEIHKALKDMRKFVNKACDQNKPFKKAVGELRREIRMKLGQIVKDKSQNREPMNKIFTALEQSLQLESPGVDPGLFMVSKPEPLEGALNNGNEIPILFIFLLNMFAKYAISQLINEAGVNPEIADPIGVVIIQVFARKAFLWRGESLIDIFMAKMRIACPVVFGVRGNETTEQGRASLGWLRDSKEAGSSYMSEEQHGSRMTGLAAGYAALSLRDFTKSTLKNPWPPHHYWQTMASIVSTPPTERSTTQYQVLRALIDGFESTFLKFYGNAAMAALKVALISFPEGASAPGSSVDPGSSAVGGVKVLVEKLARAGIQVA